METKTNDPIFHLFFRLFVTFTFVIENSQNLFLCSTACGTACSTACGSLWKIPGEFDTKATDSDSPSYYSKK